MTHCLYRDRKLLAWRELSTAGNYSQIILLIYSNYVSHNKTFKSTNFILKTMTLVVKI